MRNIRINNRSKDQRQKSFISCIKRSYNITEASQQAKIGRATFYYWLKNDPDFVKRFATATNGN